MITILDLPPEIIQLIVLLIEDLDAAPVSLSRPKINRRLCPCADDETSDKEPFPESKRDHRAPEQDLFRFATSHPYFRDCIVTSGRCATLNLWMTADGIVSSRREVVSAAVR